MMDTSEISRHTLENLNQQKKRIVISLGDPAGIGPEIILKALGELSLPPDSQPIIIGCQKKSKFSV